MRWEKPPCRIFVCDDVASHYIDSLLHVWSQTLSGCTVARVRVAVRDWRTGGRPEIPLWAKLLCTLDVLGRGLYFDDVASRADIGVTDLSYRHLRSKFLVILDLIDGGVWG